MSRFWSRGLPAGVALTTLAVAVLGLLGSCSKKLTSVIDLPPETVLFIQGPVDAVNHVVHFYWFGSDPDGQVVGFQWRFLSPRAPADTQWAFTTNTDSVFTIITADSNHVGGFVSPTFEVRAIDNAPDPAHQNPYGQPDPTPASEVFKFNNQPPTLALSFPPGQRDTTFYSVTLNWNAQDIDGDPTKMWFRVWLNGNAAHPDTTRVSAFTVPTAKFVQGDSAGSGLRTVYVQAIDDGGLASVTALTRWYVRPPAAVLKPDGRARLLIVDNVARTDGDNFFTDTLFSNPAARNLDPGTYSILRLESTQPFRSAKDVEQTFKLFDAVIWYRGNTDPLNPPTALTNFQDGIAAYLDAEGQVFLSGPDLIDGVGASGALREDWVSRYLSSDSMYTHLTPRGPTVSWDVQGSGVLSSPLSGDRLLALGDLSGVRGLAVRDTNDVALWARQGALSQLPPFDVPVGVNVNSRHYLQPGSSAGRLILATMPLLWMNGSRNAPHFLTKVYQRLGLTRTPWP